MPNVAVLHHVPYERLGAFEPVFVKAGLTLLPFEAYRSSCALPEAGAIDGLVVMGGPMGVNDQAKHPFLKRELTLIAAAVKRGVPVLGVCLGAQLLAAALGARVTANPQKEIGWYPLMREVGADGDPLMRVFGQTETVFQWHGDTWTLPRGAVRLASSPLCAEQAFRYGSNAWALQFHVEVTAAMIRAWMTTPLGRSELAALEGVIDPAAIRKQAPGHLGRLQELAAHVAQTFVEASRSFSEPVQRRTAKGAYSDAGEKRASAQKR